MKKNEKGYPCFNLAPRGGEAGAPDNNFVRTRENGDAIQQPSYSGTQRAKEGCSQSRDNNGQINYPSLNNWGSNLNCDEVPLAYVYAPTQKFCMLYSAEQALKHGTLFENLYKPLGVYGNE